MEEYVKKEEDFGGFFSFSSVVTSVSHDISFQSNVLEKQEDTHNN